MTQCIFFLGHNLFLGYRKVASTKGGFLSEKSGGFLLLPKNVPFYYPKLLNPVHGNDKMSILKKITFTGLIYLQVQEVGFRSTTNNLICLKHFTY